MVARIHDGAKAAPRTALAMSDDAVAGIHDGGKTAPRTGLAISGGGIRSATFALGVLQGLARRRLLQDFDFVSTVSGGGYIGSWLSSWSRRDAWGIRGVAGMLASRPARRLDPEPTPIRHLRAFSNYLTPKLGGLSADTWTLIATYLRNLVINWLVLVPLLVVLVVLPRLLVSGVRNPPDGRAAAVAGVGGALILAVALRNLVVQRPISDWNKRRKFTDRKFLLQCVVPMLAASVLLVLAWSWYAVEPPLRYVVLVTTALCLGAFVSFVRELTSEKAVERKADEREPHRKTLRIVGELAASLVAGVGGGALAWLLATRLFPLPRAALSAAQAVRWPIDDPSLDAVTAAYAVFGVPALLGILFLQATLFVGIAGKTNHDFDREWWARASGWVLITGVAWIVLAAVAIYGPVGIYHVPKAITAVGGAAGLFSVVAGWSAKTKASPAGDGPASPGIVGKLLGLAVPLFIAFVLAALSLGITALLGLGISGRLGGDVAAASARLDGLATAKHPQTILDKNAEVEQKLVADLPRWRSYEHFRVLYESHPNDVLLLFAGSLALALVASWFIGINVFSMHALYRNRLVRAYLGASRWSRDPNAFTGFDPRDNLSMHDLRPEYLWYYSFRDVPALAKRLRGQETPALKTLSDVWGEKLGDIAMRVLDAAEKGKVEPAFYIAANGVIATADLLPTNPQQEVLRPLRNRRFVELAFGDDVYPSPMPALCVQDLRDPETFPDVFAQSAAKSLHARFRRKKPLTGKGRLSLSELLDELNEVIATADLKADKAFASLDVDDSAFAVVDAATLAKFFGEGARVVHRMIDNRLRLERATPRAPGAKESAIAPLRPAKGFHLVNICLNLTGGEQLAWQERKGESFTASPFVAGNYRLGYRDTRDYGQVSLGTAVTISGAAASPNMGYHSSPALAFLLTLFNVRLGWWLGNPGLAGQQTYRRRNPRFSLLPLVAEATGNTNDDFGYVYLSDGGHFENLGLYELVLRRCHQIVVSDAGADPKYAYDDLGNAVRKIRVDLGIPIRITRMGIIPPDEKTPGKYCAVGEIDYSFVDGKDAPTGKFLYVKPVVYQGDEELPRDVLNYDRQSADFPHESTGDQWFSESQFESYRRLGEFALDQICAQGIKAGAIGGQAVTIESIEQLIDVAGQGLEPIPEWAEASAAPPPVELDSPAGDGDQSESPPTTAD